MPQYKYALKVKEKDNDKWVEVWGFEDYDWGLVEGVYNDIEKIYDMDKNYDYIVEILAINEGREGGVYTEKSKSFSKYGRQ
jgi:hypothetical protein